jgi:hypothetical protein
MYIGYDNSSQWTTPGQENGKTVTRMIFPSFEFTVYSEETVLVLEQIYLLYQVRHFIIGSRSLGKELHLLGKFRPLIKKNYLIARNRVEIIPARIKN